MTDIEQQAVTQADREAAAEFLKWDMGSETRYVREVRSGDSDDHPLVQSFARHRLQAISDTVERCAGIAMKVGSDLIPLPGNPLQMHGTYAQGAFAAMKAIATAIRALPVGEG